MTQGQGVRFELLGPLRASRDTVEIRLGPPRQCTVLAVLLLQEGRPMSYGALVEAVWGAHPPSHVRNLVQKYVSGIRRALSGDGAPDLVWTGTGYRLDGAAPDDLLERRALLRAALVARDSGDLRRSIALAAQAEAMWRGEFAEGLGGPSLEAERRRWEEKRLMVLEARMEAELALGNYRECVHELVRQVATRPLRERLVELLMLALYRGGRSSDALLVYEDTRRRIAAEIGCDPGPALRELHQRMLRQDPALLPRTPTDRGAPATAAPVTAPAA
ncbi:AfsR/SARP family transcriptional regulator [Streptomyces piniterrae]|uniref:AfsR/SARP family transcriptional regulator n=1 Tax=Streptomyces piniterrae TaxID=2571125 RepID=A0A4U0NJ93_9ACTN|nr:AfsR/SARP family transcriptional regulator [Streptomyces piniterrae]TJZ54351.1 AfsR/SARP family transcriptional regulator [Streptomyces piniterrae]